MSSEAVQAPLYPPCRVVGDLVFVSGQNAEVNGYIQSDNIVDQTKTIFELLAVTLAGAGCTFQDVIKVNGFLHTEDDFEQFNQVYREYFGPQHGSYPARSMALGVLTQKHQQHKALIEIELVAQKRA
ncbi:RidA family protein [Pseudoalteromonas sp. R3]|uniref:RidA family protein n=1 Tax=Pseudoalteromonas sp. R3 TaxID=1709477 RepID=UPI0006B5BF08|nr:RidA family protein [Pseudoalteromonas sp. R3]AZZ95792.1 RidA family protein [Pseudoalteromonas sp. R3]